MVKQFLILRSLFYSAPRRCGAHGHGYNGKGKVLFVFEGIHQHFFLEMLTIFIYLFSSQQYYNIYKNN